MSDVVGKFGNVMNEKIVQVSLVSAVLFYFVANPALFQFVDNNLQKLGSVVGLDLNFEGQALLILHSLVFAVLVGVTIRYLFEPLMKRKLVGNSS
tara:strand:+ start:124 stop:408 length:285 start_codon:yes stop_codon:yes gene_type:complete